MWIFRAFVCEGMWAMGLCLVPICAAFAQDRPNTGDRPSERPLQTPEYLPEEPETPFELPPVDQPSELPRAGPELFVRKYAFDGNKVLPTSLLESLAEPFAGRTVRQSELEDLRQLLTLAYVERGYVNSGAVLEAGFFRDGIVTFHIVEGRIEALRVSGQGGLREEYLRQRLIPDNAPLNVNVLQERFQLLLTDPLFEKVNARLQPGESPGTAILDMDVVRARPWDLSVYSNNYRSPSIGAEALGLTGTARNATGAGDTLSVTLEEGRENSGRYVLDWTAPIVYRTDLHLRYQYENSTVLEEPLDVLDIRSVLTSAEAGISHSLVDRVARKVSLAFTVARRSNSTWLLDQPFSFVQGEPTGTSVVDAVRFEQDWVERWERQTMALRSVFTWGRTNTVESADPSVPPQRYFLWVGQGTVGVRVHNNGTSVFLRGAMQWTNDRLVPLEQFSLGGVYSVRGYPENTFVRDAGYSGSIEVRYPLVDSTAQHIQFNLVPFFDFGGAWNKGQQREQLRSVGLGVTMQIRRLYGEVFYGSKLIDVQGSYSGNLQNKGFHAQVLYAF